ncbi:MAG TPA: protein phosphatase 2C domain-containing protein [Cellulomonas sp.]
MSALVLDAAAAQWVGARERQNDVTLYGERFVAVADGAGDDLSAAVAADVAVQVWAQQADSLDSAGTLHGLLGAPAAVARALTAQGLRSSTTYAGAFLDSDGLVWLTSVGDSRVLLVRRGEVLAVSRPHNRAAEAALTGTDHVPTPQEAVTLTRSVSCDRPDVPDVAVLAGQPGDLLVVATDGIDTELALHRLVRVLAAGSDPQDLADRLVAEVRGVPDADNASCVVARVVAGAA